MQQPLLQIHYIHMGQFCIQTSQHMTKFGSLYSLEQAFARISWIQFQALLSLTFRVSWQLLRKHLPIINLNRTKSNLTYKLYIKIFILGECTVQVFINSARLIWVFFPLTRTLGSGLVFVQKTKKIKNILLQFTQPSYIYVLLDTSICFQVVKPIEVFSRKSFFTWKSPAWAHHLNFTASITTLVLLGITISLFLLMSEGKVSALLSITTLYFKWTAVTISALQNETDSKR